MIEAGDFDEDWYFDRYADVAAAVSAGVFQSGHEHFLRHGFGEGRDARELSSRAIVNISQNAPTAGTKVSTAEEVWSVSPEQQAEKFGWYWMAHPLVRARTNKLVSGKSDADGYDHLVPFLEGRGLIKPITRSLSLGCGFGALERDLATRGFLSAIDAYDISPVAVAEAQRLANDAGFEWINYEVADLEAKPLLENTYDVVFAHQSVHHVENLDGLFVQISEALKPGGFFHLNEYVGPDRFQWTDNQISLVNDFIGSLPDNLRRTPSGLKPMLFRPTVESMIRADPTEAVRSSQIMPALRRHFRVVSERPYGGTLLHLGLADIAQNFSIDNDEHVARLEEFFGVEDRAMAEGQIGSDFTVVIAERLPS